MIGVKYDKMKTDWAYLTDNFIPELEAIIKVLEYGNLKYPSEDRCNWKNVEDMDRRYTNAAIRHIMAFAQGEDVDVESKFKHIHHAITNLLFLSYSARNKQGENQV